jgi:hypothetical protein
VVVEEVERGGGKMQKAEEKAKKKEAYVRGFIEELKAKFSPEAGWEIKEELGLSMISLKYSDAYEIVNATIFLNEHGVPFALAYVKAKRDEEVLTPESCHECVLADCVYYDTTEEECTLSDEEIQEKFGRWKRKLVEVRNMIVRSVIVKDECYLDIPHAHYYRGYEVIYRGSITCDVVSAIDLLFDDIVDIACKAK